MTHSYSFRLYGRDRQSGAILFVALIFLLLLTVLGVSSMQTTVIEEKMASNTRERAIAFQAAEAGLRDAENFIEGIISTAAFNGSNGLYGGSDDEPDLTAVATWSTNATREWQGTELAKSHAAPRYMIKLGEMMGGSSPDLGTPEYGKIESTEDTYTFRITARGVGGGQDGAEVLLRSYYGRTF